MRGNRTTKINAENFNAFRSFNYPALAKAGIHIRYNEHLIRRPDPSRPMKPHYLFDTNVVVLTLFPGIQESIINSVLHVPGLKAVVLKTFGSGNAPQKEWFIRQLKEASERGIVIVNITQCQSGAVEMGRYETGLQLLQAGVISGYDSTPECAITKLMFLLGHGLPNKDIRHKMNSCLIGEITKSEVKSIYCNPLIFILNSCIKVKIRGFLFIIIKTESNLKEPKKNQNGSIVVFTP